MNYIPIEIASQNAWPAFKQIDNDGWISRYADGYTKRANSVTILHPNSISLEEQIVKHEQAYNNEGTMLFRIISPFLTSSRVVDQRKKIFYIL